MVFCFKRIVSSMSTLKNVNVGSVVVNEKFVIIFGKSVFRVVKYLLYIDMVIIMLFFCFKL